MTWIARCTTWCAACGGYLLFAGQIKSVPELVTAALLASAAWYWAFTIRRCGRARFAVSPAHARAWARAVIALGPALARTAPIFVYSALRDCSRGRLLRMEFQRGREDSPHDCARRASAVLIASLGPDSFVVRAPRTNDCVLIHTSCRGTPRAMRIG